MLVEINLLPQKEQKRYGSLIMIASLLAVVLLVAAYYSTQIYSAKSRILSVDQQIALTKKMEQKAASKPAAVESTTSASILKTAVDWAENYPIQTIPVMRQLTSLLPERGFIQSFSYNDVGDVSILVQFDSASDAAYFLNALDSSKWFLSASLSSLTTNRVQEPAAQASATSVQSNLPSASASQNAGDGTSAPIANDNSTTMNNSGAQTNSQNQTASSPQGNGTLGATTNSGSNNPASTSTAGKTDVNKDYLPRYSGQFTIVLDKTIIKKAIADTEKSSTTQGVKGS